MAESSMNPVVNGPYHDDEDNEEAEDMEFTYPEEPPLMSCHTPAQVEKHLEFLEINKCGHLLMGSSDLTGRYWGGSCWYYDNPHLAPSVEQSRTGIEFPAGVCDATFIDNENAVVGMDGGTLAFLSLDHSNGDSHFIRKRTISHHTSSIIGVDKSSDSKCILTGSSDKSVRLWNIETGICEHTFSHVHTQALTGISSHPQHSKMFLTSSLDGNVLLWDMRCPRPASCVFRDKDNCPSTLSWISLNGGSTFHYLVGTLYGEIHLRNITELNYSLFSSDFFTRSVYRLRVNPLRQNQFAACADETQVLVFNIEKERLFLKYSNKTHNDFTRGLAWMDENSLLSCGWDKRVVTHFL